MSEEVDDLLGADVVGVLEDSDERFDLLLQVLHGFNDVYERDVIEVCCNLFHGPVCEIAEVVDDIRRSPHDVASDSFLRQQFFRTLGQITYQTRQEFSMSLALKPIVGLKVALGE